jgi:hypothetical protein
MSDPIRTGPLKKREDKGEKLWKKRFGVLYEDRLDWWKTEEDFSSGKKEHGRCPLNKECATGDADAESKRSNTFFVERTRSNGKKQRFYFKAESAEDRTSWISSLQQVMSGEGGAGASGGGGGDAPADTPAEEGGGGSGGEDAPPGDAPADEPPAEDAPASGGEEEAVEEEPAAD